MIKEITFDAACGEGNKIAGYLCPANCDSSEAKGTIQICHGMADYFHRYDELITFLNNAGWNVCGMDMMGHGKTYELNKDRGMPLGYFGNSKDSAMCILKDEMTLKKHALDFFGADGKLVLMGHSMGSFVARNIYMTPEYSKGYDKFIFASTMGPNPAVDAGIFLSTIGMLCGLKSRPGKLLNTIAFGSYNKRIPNRKTDFDWVCSDDEVVKVYVNDPLAGFLFTWKGFKDLFTLVKRMQSKDGYKNAKDAPCLLTFGEDDPVAGYGKGAKTVVDKYKLAGRDVTAINYGKYRHEIHNEPIKTKLYEDIVNFCNK